MSLSSASPSRLLKKVSPGWLAILLSLALVVWLLTGDRQSAKETAPPPKDVSSGAVFSVETLWSEAEWLSRQQVTQGQLLAWQQVRIKSQVAGRVERLLRQQGEAVAEGDVLLQLSDEGRSAHLQQARAALKLRETELASAQALKASRFVAETELTRLESELAKARADLAAAELAYSYSRPSAPFSGQVDRRHVEVGEWIQPGADLLVLVDISRLRVTAQVPQQEVEAIVAGQSVTLRLLDGRELKGVVSFVSQAADPATRSFYMEVQADNPQMWRVAGASATVQVHLPDVLAHKVSPALISLDELGRLGVHTLNDSQQVVFQPVQVLSIDNRGATLTGLPPRVRLITQGAGFVVPGQQVQAHPASAVPPVAAGVRE